MSPGDFIDGSAEDGGNTLPLGRGGCPAAEQDRRHPTFIKPAPFDQLRQSDLMRLAQFFDRGRHDRGCSRAPDSKVLFEPELSIANVARVHRVTPTDFVHTGAKRSGDPLPLIGAGGPSAECNGFNSGDGQSGPLGDIVNREGRLFEQQVNRFQFVSTQRDSREGRGGSITGIDWPPDSTYRIARRNQSVSFDDSRVSTVFRVACLQ
jgi:hypothetical protein